MGVLMKKYCGLLILLITIGSASAAAQSGNRQLISFDFVDQQIREILYAFSTYSQVSIIGDDTVNGTGSFQFNGTGFEQAFESFLLANRLYAEKNPEVWTVSKIQINVTDSAILIKSFDASASQILDKLTRKTNATIIRDILPSLPLSLHLEAATPREAAELIMKPFPEYAVETENGYIQIKKITALPAPYISQVNQGYINISGREGIYDIEIENSRMGEILEKLFYEAKREYISFVRNDLIIEHARYGNKTLIGALSLLLEQGGGEFREINGIIYIFPVQQSEIIGNIRNQGKSWHSFKINYRTVSDMLPLIQTRFGSLQIIPVQENNTFLAHVTETTAVEIRDFILTVDTFTRTEAIRLKYIKTEDLYRSLPPSAKREDLADTGDGNTFFFTGSDERRAAFLRDLEIIDRPRPRIRYDLFIIQVQDTASLNWNFQAEARAVRPGDRTMVTGQLGSLLNLNFDIITLFGYQFAAKLNAAISENQANVFADTTLFGLSGQEIKFQNTSTYRYRDSNIDPDTGKPVYTGITREIVSGLVLEITGWVSGDGMITTNVTASVSKRGADVSSAMGNPPPTSEKVLTTQVRARSGETVVLSGLRQNDSSIVEQRTPFLSKIPILKWFFKSINRTAENTQMIIYLVPHVDLSGDEHTVDGSRSADIYARYIEPYLRTEEK